MPSKIVIALLLVLAWMTAGCSQATTPNRTEYLVAGSADGAPVGCSPEDIARRMAALLEEINRGDPGVVDEYFGRKSMAPFRWYSMTEGGETDAEKRHFVAYSWDDLAVYWEQRYQQKESLQLRSIDFNGWEQERGVVHFGPIVLARHADDLRPGLGGPESIAQGKGAYHCATQAFVVLSLGMHEDGG
jgi:hypothetical protein